MEVTSDPARQPLVDVYRERAVRYGELAQHSAARSARLTHVRTVLFLAAAACLALGWAAGWPAAAGWLAAGVALLIGFAGAVTWHRRVSSEGGRQQELARINQEGLARLEHRWEQIPLTAVQLEDHHEAGVANDLDLFGRASLFHLCGFAQTSAGIGRLRDWLLHPAEPAEIGQRQAAVAELAPQLDLRQQLYLRGRGLVGSQADPGSLLEWAEGPSWIAERAWLKWLSWLLPLLAALLLVAALAGLVPFSAWLAALIVNMAVCSGFSRPVQAVYNRISSSEGEIERYCELFALASEAEVRSAELVRLQQELTEHGGGAYRQLQHLRRIVDAANFRFSPLVHWIVQALLLWDFHVLARLETWQRRSGADARHWFDALGQYEALASLASLAHDNPAWAFPQVDPHGPKILQARSLGHPLLPAATRVTNDVEVGPPGTVLLVTGSNMSGKSTLLRSLGVNIVLAQTGAPVCAAELRMPPLTVTTSMRIHDSLESGVSFYMAELKRLKEIVDQAHEYSGRPDQTLFYLLDEILQGTNSVERHIAVQRVLAHLVAQRAIGAVSTHDLELAKSRALERACRPVHFRETIHTQDGKQRMTFDYQLRTGVATTTNALKLLEMVGLSWDEDSATLPLEGG